MASKAGDAKAAVQTAGLDNACHRGGCSDHLVAKFERRRLLSVDRYAAFSRTGVERWKGDLRLSILAERGGWE